MKVEKLTATRTRLSFPVNISDMRSRGVGLTTKQLRELIDHNATVDKIVYGEIDEPLRTSDMSESDWTRRLSRVDDRYVGFSFEIRRHCRNRNPDGTHLVGDILLCGPKASVAAAILKSNVPFKLIPRIARRPSIGSVIIGWDMADAS